MNLYRTLLLRHLRATAGYDVSTSHGAERPLKDIMKVMVSKDISNSQYSQFFINGDEITTE